MSTIFLVRHAQASFLSDDYDRLSERGHEQAAALGRAWARRGVTLDRVLVGPRVRHGETAAGVAEAFREAGLTLPGADMLQAFDEYPAEEVLEGLLGALQALPDFEQLLRDAQQIEDPRARGRAFDRLLQHALFAWADGKGPPEVESHADFERRVRSAFDQVLAAEGSGRTLALFSSGGTIGALAGLLLGTDVRRRLELGWALNNASVTEIAFSGRRVSVMRFNDVGHLDHTEWTRR